MKKYAIIVAGGKGLRMNTEMPKQFIPVKGKPLLMRTIEAFVRYDEAIQIVLALPAAQMDYWNNLCKEYSFALASRIKVAKGGETRFHSVNNALAVVPDGEEALVAVHDGVRPFVSTETIAAAFDQAARSGAAVPVIDAVDSIRQLTENGSVAKDRSAFKLVQTPQVFLTSVLKSAYKQEFSLLFTDDASVVEADGHPIVLTPGNRENMKITTPFDLKVAEVLVRGIK